MMITQFLNLKTLVDGIISNFYFEILNEFMSYK